MTSTTPRQPGRPTSGHTGAGLIGDLDTGIEAGREGREAMERARERDRAMQEGDAQGGDTTVAGGPGSTTPGGISRIGSGTTGLNNYSPGSDLTAGPDSPLNRGQIGAESGGERASTGINDANRSSRDHGNTLDD